MPALTIVPRSAGDSVVPRFGLPEVDHSDRIDAPLAANHHQIADRFEAINADFEKADKQATFERMQRTNSDLQTAQLDLDRMLCRADLVGESDVEQSNVIDYVGNAMTPAPSPIITQHVPSKMLEAARVALAAAERRATAAAADHAAAAAVRNHRAAVRDKVVAYLSRLPVNSTLKVVDFSLHGDPNKVLRAAEDEIAKLADQVAAAKAAALPIEILKQRASASINARARRPSAQRMIDGKSYGIIWPRSSIDFAESGRVDDALGVLLHLFGGMIEEVVHSEIDEAVKARGNVSVMDDEARAALLRDLEAKVEAAQRRAVEATWALRADGVDVELPADAPAQALLGVA